MPKKSKHVQKESRSGAPGTAAESVNSALPAAGKKRTAAKKSRKKPAARAKGSVPKSPGKKSVPREFSEDTIQLRAYFIAERRMQLSLPGDSNTDWLEAVRQLREEASQTQL